jgi:hypothetical protein
VKVIGKVFDGRAQLIVSSGVRAAAYTIEQYAEEKLQERFSQVLVNPTGTYQSRINVRGVNQYAYSVNDDDCVYGPWLEGTGSRNSPVTKFKGYSTFRIVAAELHGAAVELADTVMEPFVVEINL